MSVPKNRRRDVSLENARRVLESLTPADAMALRRRSGLGGPPDSMDDDETLRGLARLLPILKKRRKR